MKKTNRNGVCCSLTSVLHAIFEILLCVASQMASNSTCIAAKPTGVPRYDQAVTRGVAYLASEANNVAHRETSLIAYALFKAGEPVTSPLIAQGIDDAQKRAEGSDYAAVGYDHIYLAGVDAMLLSDVDATKYHSALENITRYVESVQRPDGSWNGGGGSGDTSMAQYAMLALWAADRAEVEISLQVVERGVGWHLKYGNADGGWAYLPQGPSSPSSHNLAAAGAGSLGVGRLLLHGHKNAPKGEQGVPKKFGVLEALTNDDEKKDESTKFRPSITASVIDARIDRAFSWLSPRFPPPQNVIFPNYFFYALERAAELHNVKSVQGKDWYTAYGDALLSLQGASGGFDKGNAQYTSGRIGTCFAILYFVRSTKQIVKASVGGGLLTGGRGLPSDLSNADVSGGGVKEKRKIEGPLDELLTELSALNPDSIADAQAAIVEKVQLGNREELIGELDRIRELITHPNPELRRTAAWALGRSGNFKDANLLITALQDNDVDVLVEAYNSLSYLSRKLDGVGLPSSPFASLKEGASQAEKESAVAIWRKEAVARWSVWYLRIRPYNDRNDIFELGISTKR